MLALVLCHKVFKDEAKSWGLRLVFKQHHTIKKMPAVPLLLANLNLITIDVKPKDMGLNLITQHCQKIFYRLPIQWLPG